MKATTLAQGQIDVHLIDLDRGDRCRISNDGGKSHDGYSVDEESSIWIFS